MAAPVTRRAVAAFVVLLVPIFAFAQQNPGPESRVLPNYDVRRTSPRTEVSAAPDVQGALDQLRAERGASVRARLNPLTRGVRVLTAGDRALSAPASDRADAVSRRFLRRNARLFGLRPDDIDSLDLVRDYSSHSETLRHVTFAQTVRGVPVFGAQVLVHVNPAGEILNVSSTAVSPGVISPPTTSSGDAVLAASANVRPDVELPLVVASGPIGSDERTVYAAGPYRSPIEASLVLFPMRDGLHPAWRVLLEPEGFPQKYEVIVDARGGAVLYRQNRVLYATGNGRVLQSDVTAARDSRRPDVSPFGSNPGGPGEPAVGCPPVTNHNVRALTAPFRDPTTVLFNTGRLEGNNSHVYRGAAPVEGASGSLQADGTWQFDFPFNSADAAETQLFFGANFLHDFFYDLGFDEAAGNFQADNFGRGGLGNDSLIALARASGRNNATFEPTADGQSATMSMFLWDASGCWGEDVDGDGTLDLDASIDSDVYIHEFHHGVSTRLNSDWSGPEAEAIGEGGSDFFAYSINNDTHLGEYSSPPLGIRTVNDKTYGNWACYVLWFFVFCEPHDNGEIWANVMWDLRQRFIADTADSELAIRTVHRLYVDGLKLSPPQPTMLDLRDAMLQADGITHPSTSAGGSVNHCRIWDVFAVRGMGAAARDTNDTGGTYTVVEDFTGPAECPPPPVPPAVTIAATDARAAEAPVDPGLFTLTRTGDVSLPLVVSLSVTGTATPTSDYVPLAASVEIPAGSASLSIAVTPVDDPLVEADETVILTVSSGTGYKVGNPSSATVTIVSDDQPSDLIVSALTAPTTGGAGAVITVSDTTKNQGAGPALASSTRFYLSHNTVKSSSDPLLGARAVPPLAPAASSSGSVSVTIPADTTAGTYFIVAQADGDGTNPERSETNNTYPAVLRVGPDLVVTTTAPVVVTAGLPFVVNDTTKNQGGGGAAATATRFFLSVDATLDSSDVALGSRAIGPLAAGAVNSGSTSVAIPTSTPAGSYYVIARADADNAVAETIETNNSAFVVVRTGPDLTVTVSAPLNAGVGISLAVTDTVKNQGTAPAGASVTRMYLSTNGVLDGSDIALGSRSVPALDPSASNSGQTLVTIPAGTTTGTYYLIAQTDANSAVAEMTETNNTGWAQIRVGPDLTIGSVLVSSSTTGPGAAITVTDVTKNAGTGIAPASTTRLYLGASATAGSGDVLLGSRAVPELGAGVSSSGATTVVIPASTTTGTWFIRARADADNTVVEISETNNTAAIAVRVGPDLVVTSFTAPTTITTGTTISITDVTTNQGGGAAGASTTRYALSLDYSYSSSDILLGAARSVPALAAGANSGASTTVTIPSGIAGGKYYLIAVSDADGVVPETVETNNTRSLYVTVIAGT